MPRKREHRLDVTSERRDPPDLRALSRAVLDLAKPHDTEDSTDETADTPSPTRPGRRPS